MQGDQRMKIKCLNRTLFVAGACKKESQAGVRDSSAGQPLTGSKGRTAGPDAGAKAGTAPAVAVRPASGEPARIQQPVGSAVRWAGRPHRERKPAGGREGGQPPGNAPRWGPRRPPRPLGPMVEQDMRDYFFLFFFLLFSS